MDTSLVIQRKAHRFKQRSTHSTLNKKWQCIDLKLSIHPNSSTLCDFFSLILSSMIALTLLATVMDALSEATNNLRYLKNFSLIKNITDLVTVTARSDTKSAGATSADYFKFLLVFAGCFAHNHCCLEVPIGFWITGKCANNWALLVKLWLKRAYLLPHRSAFFICQSFPGVHITAHVQRSGTFNAQFCQVLYISIQSVR